MIRMERFSQFIAWVVAAAVVLLILVGIARSMSTSDLFMMSVGLAVSAIPEGLPIAISVALAISMRRMAKAHVIVRRMPAVEALGSCTMIATDKTGTLTLNELTVTDIACRTALKSSAIPVLIWTPARSVAMELLPLSAGTDPCPVKGRFAAK
ncbi:hypothetical protein T190_30045 [Sinorhizobium meliloti CCBAU 01290]|nr:hypothetical protein T190_30045 [Sinorhizobium meliloti CCBAU 01290]